MKNKLMLFILVVLFNLIYGENSLKEGVDYKIINVNNIDKDSKPTKIKKRILIKEIFSFQCIHCKDLEPLMERYVAANQKKVNFERIHALWNDDKNMKNLAKLNATLQMNGLNKLYIPVFNAIFNQQNLANAQVLTEFLKANKLSKEQIDKFFSTYNSFDVDATVRGYKVDTLNPVYNIEGTPTIIINDKYMVMPAQPARLVEVTSELVKKINNER